MYMKKRWEFPPLIRIVVWVVFGLALVLLQIFAGGSALLLLGFMFCTMILGEINYLSHCVGVLIKTLSKHVDDKSLNFLAEQTNNKANSPPDNGNKSRKSL